MRYADVGSWRILEDQGWDLTTALYVRDTLALQRWEESAAVPPLDPPVDSSQELGHSVGEQTAAAWHTWWHALLQQRSAVSPADDPRVWIRRTNTNAELGAVLDRLLDSAYSWADAQKAEHIRRFKQQARSERLVISQIVSAVEESLGRPARPFSLTVTTLPVGGPWSYRISEEALLVSLQLRNDATALRDFLRPIIQVVA